MIAHKNKKARERTMEMNAKRLIILLIVIAAGMILGRLAVRAVLNLLLGGTLFGGNVL